jgi:hypothetical protein
VYYLKTRFLIQIELKNGDRLRGYLLEYFGRGYTLNRIIGASVLAIGLLFYIILIGNLFRIHIFVLMNRISYEGNLTSRLIGDVADNFIILGTVTLWSILSFRNRIVISTIIACLSIEIFAVLIGNNDFQNITCLISVPIIFTSIIISNPREKLIRSFRSSLFFNYFGALVVFLSLFSISLSAYTIYSIGHNKWYVDIVYVFFVLASSIAPVLLTILLFAVPIRALITMIPVCKSKISSIVWTVSNERNPRILLLSLAIGLSIIIALLPHLGRATVMIQEIGVDTSFYLKWVTAIGNSHDLSEFIRHAFFIESNGDRPLVLIFIYLIWSFTHFELFQIIEYLPLILAPSLAIVSYFFAKEITSDERASLLAAILSAVSFQTLVGIYSGFYANWMGLLFGYSSIVFCVRFIKHRKKADLLFFLVLYLALTFTHVYTWSVITLVLLIFLAINIKSAGRHKRYLIIVIFIMLVVVIGMIIKNVTTSPRALLGHKFPDIAGLKNFSNRLSIVYDSVQTYYGSQLSNFIILGLGVIWIFLYRVNNLDSKVLGIFLSFGALTLFIGDVTLQTRIIYDIPFQVIAGSTLAFISRKKAFRFWSVVVIIWLVAIAIRSVSNLYFVPPSVVSPT